MRLIQPDFGSSNSAHAIAIGSVGKKNAVQIRNSIVRRQRTFVRMTSHASTLPSKSAIGTRMSTSKNVFAIACHTDAVENALVQPLVPQTVGLPGSEVRKLPTSVMITGAIANAVTMMTGSVNSAFVRCPSVVLTTCRRRSRGTGS